MTEIRCTNCGGAVLHEAGQSTDQGVKCPRCSSWVDLRGAHAAVVAELPLVKAAFANAPNLGLDSYRTGLIVIEPEEVSEPALAVEVKVKGYLTQEGLTAESGDLRLRGGITVVGREDGDIIVADQAVSARHFQIEEQGSEFLVRDLGSSNGTFVNGRMVRSAPLTTGDRIQVGSTVFTFSVRHTIPM